MEPLLRYFLQYFLSCAIEVARYNSSDCTNSSERSCSHFPATFCNISFHAQYRWPGTTVQTILTAVNAVAATSTLLLAMFTPPAQHTWSGKKAQPVLTAAKAGAANPSLLLAMFSPPPHAQHRWPGTKVEPVLTADPVVGSNIILRLR
jgi:hypothetical protein